MSERVRSVPMAAGGAEANGRKSPRANKKQPVQKALEIVAMRGRDVIAVRHLLNGGVAWVGNVADALVRMSMRDFGGQPVMLAEVAQREFTLYVPPRARARLHRKKDLPRLLVGPCSFKLSEGERAVVVLGPVQIRVQVTEVEALVSNSSSTLGWIAFVSVIYIAALAICASLAPTDTPVLEQGAMQRLTAPLLTHVALTER